MKVLAADQYILCCGLLRTLVLIYRNVRVTSANSIDEVLACILKVPDFDLVLLDANMPGMENFAGLRRTVEKLRDVPVIVTSPSENRAQIIAAIRNGARGYIPPSSNPSVLQHALPLVMSGEFYIPASALRGQKAGALRASNGLALPTLSTKDGLTPRQREITLMLAEGKSNKEIARALKVREGTVKLHVRGILRSLGVRNRTEAALAAVYAGYLPKRALSSVPSTSECAASDTDHEASRASADNNRGPHDDRRQCGYPAELPEG